MALGMVMLAGVILAVSPFWVRAMRSRRRRRWRKRSFPAEWERVLQERWPRYRRLPEELRAGIRERILVLQAEKRFEACGGLAAVTDEMRVLILGQAALLLLGGGGRDYFPRLRSILVYPNAYRDQAERRFGWGEDDERDLGVRLGESWTSGSVVLAWDSVKHGAAGRHDGINVVFHEFAHQLDQDDGRSDGVPPLETQEDYLRWAEVFQARYEELLEEIHDGRAPLLDEYGATDPAEFFAVATETFFERPRRMRREMGDLDEELRRYYEVDPAGW